MNFTILRAAPEHLEQVAPLFNAYRQFYGQAPDLDGARAFLGERLEKNDSVIFLALDQHESSSTAAGFTQLYPSFSSTGMRRIWILNDLFVVPPFRRRGAGTLLMETAREMAVASDAARLTLSTARDNSQAKALYESLGYRLDEVFDHYNLGL